MYWFTKKEYAAIRTATAKLKNGEDSSIIISDVAKKFYMSPQRLSELLNLRKKQLREFKGDRVYAKR